MNSQTSVTATVGPKVAVIIPYFQRESGILTKAIKSIARQIYQPFEIIVVDDCSPVPALAELTELLATIPNLPLRIVERPNGGPAAARNSGLDNVSANVEYIAFLDSDDEWHDNHLLHALTGLEAGNDFYFSNYYRLNQSSSVFAQAKLFTPNTHPPLSETYPVSRYVGNMKEQILSGNVIGTPTVVYRFRKFSNLRFREQFVYAGEDYLFWLELSTLTDAYAFGTTPEVTCGRGVNIFASSGWGTERAMDRLYYEAKLAHAIPKLFQLDVQQTQRNAVLIRELRLNTLKNLLHRLAKRKSINLKLLMRHLRIDPLLPLFVPMILANILLQRFGRTRPLA